MAASPPPPPPAVRDFRALVLLSPAQRAELAALDARDRAGRLARGAALLNTGASIPLVGLGTWQAPPGEVGAAVYEALRRGCRHIDCASVYANEREIGDALARAFSEGVCAREDVFVTSKLWNDAKGGAGGAGGGAAPGAPSSSAFPPASSSSSSAVVSPAVEAACRASLERLGLDYLDLYLVHWPVVTGCSGPELDPPYLDTWRAMERLTRPQGGGGGDGGGDGKAPTAAAAAATAPPLARAIGVSNLSERKLRALMAAASVPPAVNQVEAHPLWRNGALVRACAGLGVHVTAYSPLGSSPEAAAALGEGPTPSLLRHPAALSAAESASRRTGQPRSPAQVVLRWNLERGVSVLPKSVRAERIAANLDVLSAQHALSEEERLSLSSVEPQARMVAGGFWLTARGPYRTLAELWDEDAGADARQREAVAALRRLGPDWADKEKEKEKEGGGAWGGSGACD